jgi:hypothetical protein
MYRRCFSALVLFSISIGVKAQSVEDTTVSMGSRTITLKPVIVNTKLNVSYFIERIKNDSSFYKAFKNLRVLSYQAIHDIRMMNKKGNTDAYYHGKTRQYRKQDCRFMETKEEEVQGDFFDEKRNMNYYTAQMYASLFFTRDSVCHETNIIGNNAFSLSGKKGLDKHKEQLKMLFFNPGKRIYGLPFMSKKTALYEESLAEYYDMTIDMERHNGKECYVLKQKVKPGREDDVVVREMNTWFEDSTYEVQARDYHLQYDAGVYDFEVHMQVEMTHVNQFVVPSLIRYNGNWKVMFKKREKSVFTATLYDFE